MTSGNTDPTQGELVVDSYAPLAADIPLVAIDLFAGIGGLSAGFHDLGFRTIGIDREGVAGQVYVQAGFGDYIVADLSQRLPLNAEQLKPSIVLGGPPCRPWSIVNQQRRGANHGDYSLLSMFIDHVLALSPRIVIMENVPALGGDPQYDSGLKRLAQAGYDTGKKVVHYDAFGAATKRRRLFSVGVQNMPHGASVFFRLLRNEEQPASTVGEAIRALSQAGRGSVADHDWSELKSIGNYAGHYISGKYGWARLSYDAPAPSFGSVAKTYILHPEASPDRVISVREALAIMGFESNVRFPDGTSRTRRYQMAANAVSPMISRALARVSRKLLTGQ